MDRSSLENPEKKEAPVRRKPVPIEPNAPAKPEKRTWTNIKSSSTLTSKSLRCSPPGVFFEPRQETYTASTFIPKGSFLDTDAVAVAGVTQKLIVDMPTMKTLELCLKPGQGFQDFVVTDGFCSGCVMRCQRQKVYIRILSEFCVNQGDSFFVPIGVTLGIRNTAERLSALIQLVLVKRH